MNQHPAITLRRSGERVEIDERMVSLIELCWSKGLETIGCCQGYLEGESMHPGVQDHPANRWAYVGFMLDSASALIEALEPLHRIGPETHVVASRECGMDDHPGWRLNYRPDRMSIVVNFPASDLATFTGLIQSL